VELPVTAWRRTDLRDPSTLPRSRSRSRGVPQEDRDKFSRLTCGIQTDLPPKGSLLNRYCVWEFDRNTYHAVSDDRWQANQEHVFERKPWRPASPPDEQVEGSRGSVPLIRQRSGRQGKKVCRIVRLPTELQQSQMIRILGLQGTHQQFKLRKSMQVLETMVFQEERPAGETGADAPLQPLKSLLVLAG
jgi:hypothetical protein